MHEELLEQALEIVCEAIRHQLPYPEAVTLTHILSFIYAKTVESMIARKAMSRDNSFLKKFRFLLGDKYLVCKGSQRVLG